ncbi:MAG: response regulator [Victivallales bacterium]|jgi:CheY-like chemotaxis protein
MNQIISWLMDVETAAHVLYYEGANYFKEDAKFSEFLLEMSEDEAFHYQTIKNINDLITSSGIKYISGVKIDDNIKTRVLNPLKFKLELLHKKTLTKHDMYGCLISTEFSEWNDIFIYVINSVIKQKIALQIIPAKIQKHLVKLEHFFKSDDNLKGYYHELLNIPKFWNYRILVVEDDKTISALLRSVLGIKYPMIDVAENGEEAYKLFENNYYDAIICDIDMPIMTGIEFYNKIKPMKCFDNDSFIFLTGGVHDSFFEENKLKHVSKPFSLQNLLDEVEKILI